MEGNDERAAQVERPTAALMPYTVRKLGPRRYGIMVKRGGKLRKVGTSSTKAKAQASVRARMAAEKR